VEISVTVTVARSQDEAERIARGENVLIARTDAEEEAAAAKVAAEAFFEPGAGEAGEGEQPEAEAAADEAEPAKKPRAKKKAAEAEAKSED
jgi:large subunit ribosomal protein L9